MDMPDFKHFVKKIANNETLNVDEAAQAFDIMMSGDATPSQMGAFLMGLKLRGETQDEITGAVKTMRAKAHIVSAPDGAIDIVGTGGDMAHTLNISTATAIVVAGSGVTVAKHGNRASSSKSGTADALACLGLDLDTDFENVEKAMREANIGFLMAQRHHGAMRNVGPTRIEMGVPTIFNLLGPLSNPALVKRYMIGTYRADTIDLMAQTLGDLGAEHAWVVHGADGLDELSTTGTSQICEYKDGRLNRFEMHPSDVGLNEVTLEDLRGGTPEENAAAITRLLDGENGAYRDVVLYNAAASLVVAGKADDMKNGISIASASIDNGQAKAALAKLVEIAGLK
ncbi:anthranilate phosphoribosyltransferase [Curvivirga sp.]|uniref:anthranilate phosphoribosyltransferase n=1 Tax=Curvivirga sp. TaxID=2856848 RepID=UPI003B5B31E7